MTCEEYGRRTNVWNYITGHGHTTNDIYAYKHPAMFPEKLAEDHIMSWSNPGDLVFDPMCGSGTTLKMAKAHGRKYLGIETSPEYCEIARKRIASVTVIIGVADMRHYDNWDDNEDKIEVGKFLQEHGYPTLSYDPYICFDKLTGEMQMISMNLTKEEVQRYKVQHPDIIALGHHFKPMFVVEIDGSIHHTKPGMKQTERRNSTYRNAGIKYIVLDKADLKVLKMTWQEYLDAELKEL